jgi:hypothetical protein
MDAVTICKRSLGPLTFNCGLQQNQFLVIKCAPVCPSSLSVWPNVQTFAYEFSSLTSPLRKKVSHLRPN